MKKALTIIAAGLLALTSSCTYYTNSGNYSSKGYDIPAVAPTIVQPVIRPIVRPVYVEQVVHPVYVRPIRYSPYIRYRYSCYDY
jgi:hypothetical protein